MSTDAKKRAVKKYQEKFDTVVVRVPKGEKQIIDIHAAAHGESIMKFVRRAVCETMARDKDSEEV